jgi:hypothetical protein
MHGRAGVVNALLWSRLQTPLTNGVLLVMINNESQLEFVRSLVVLSHLILSTSGRHMQFKQVIVHAPLAVRCQLGS